MTNPTHIDGGPAFPSLHSIDGNWIKEPRPEFSGMSLRDYFAAHALAGLLASGPHDCEAPGIAHDAYLFADAMLAARNRQQDGKG